MSGSVHEAPEANGTRFGRVVVTVDAEVGDCVVHVPRHGSIEEFSRRIRLHSLDEIAGAYSTQLGLSATDPIAGDIASALKHAGQMIRANQGAS